MTDQVPHALTQQALALKLQALSRFFPPDAIDWEVSQGQMMLTKNGDKVSCVPCLKSVAIRDRLDEAMLPHNWRERYETPSGRDYVRCVLEVRFSDSGDWVSRVGLSSRKNPDESHDEALRNAASSLGVGRYLSAYPQLVAWENHKLAHTPRLPDCALPTEYARCGREMGARVRSLINQACEEATKRGATLNRAEVAKSLVERFGYSTGASGLTDLGQLENRHASSIMALVNDWLGELAIGVVNGSKCPAVELVKMHKKENFQNPPSPQTPEKQDVPATAGKTS